MGAKTATYLIPFLLILPMAAAETWNLGDENITCEGSSCEIDSDFENKQYQKTVDSGAATLLVKSGVSIDEAGDNKANKWYSEICVDWYEYPNLASQPQAKCSDGEERVDTWDNTDTFDYYDDVSWAGAEFPVDGEYRATVQITVQSWVTDWDSENEVPDGNWQLVDDESSTATLIMQWGSCIPCGDDGEVHLE